MQGSINFDGSLVGNITGGGGGGGDEIIITPVVTSGTKIADVSVNGVEKDLYCPTPPTPPEVDITPVVTSGTKIADVSVGGVVKDLYTPDYGADIAALDGRIDIAEDNITSLTGRVGTSEGNITNLAGHMTEAETDITEIKQSLSQLDGLNVIKRITTPASIISFSDGSNLPMYKLEIEIDNVSGCTEANVVVSPLNIASLYNGQIYEDGSWVGNNARLTNVQTAQSNVYFLKAGTYTLDYDKLNSNAPSLLGCSLLTKDDNYTIIDNFANAWNSLPFTFTLTQDGYLYFTVRKDPSATLNADDYKVKILGQSYNVEFKDGSNPLTVYSGTLDIITGLLTDNDTTPPTYYNLPPISAKTLRDNNNIYCDTGNIIEVDYTGVINFS